MAQETAADSIEKLELQAAQSRWGDSTPAEGDPAGSGRCNLHTGCSHAILVSFRSRGVCADPYYIQLGGWGQWDQDWEQHQASGEVDTYSLLETRGPCCAEGSAVVWPIGSFRSLCRYFPSETGLAGNPAAQAHSPASGSSPAAGSPPGSCLDGWGAPEAGSPGHLEGSQSYGIPPGCSSLASPGSCGIVPLGNPDNQELTVKEDAAAYESHTQMLEDTGDKAQALLDHQVHVDHWKTRPWNCCWSQLVGRNLESLKNQERAPISSSLSSSWLPIRSD